MPLLLHAFALDLSRAEPLSLLVEWFCFKLYEATQAERVVYVPTVFSWRARTLDRYRPWL